MDAWDGTFELVDPRVIVSDHKYQREEKDSHIAEIASRFDWRKFGVIACAKRTNGMFYAIDGQQRLNAALRFDPPPAKVPVVWFPYERVEREADDFGGINETRKSLHPLEKHRARLTAKQPDALAIERALDTAGFTLSYGGDGAEMRSITSVASVYRIYNEFGEDGLLHMLVILREAWPNYRLSVSSLILNGLLDVAVEQNGTFERARVVGALKRTDPTKILAKANEIKYKQGGTKRLAVRRAFKDLAKV